jgi:hypothetical protein
MTHCNFFCISSELLRSDTRVAVWIPASNRQIGVEVLKDRGIVILSQVPVGEQPANYGSVGR